LWKASTDEPGAVAVVSGGLWNIRHLGRSGTWKLWKNDKQLLTEGTIDDASGSSTKPLSLASGKGAAAALQNIPFEAGDTFRLEILEPDYVGVRLTIEAAKKHDLSQEFSLQANPTAEGWQYSESMANGGDVVGPALNPGNDPGDPAHWVTEAWRIGLARVPSEQEQRSAIRLMEDLAGDPARCQPLENPPPSLATLPPRQAAALSKFCLALFNLDEFIYIE